MSPVGHKQTALARDSALGQVFNFVVERRGIDDRSIAYYASTFRVQNAGRNQVEDKLAAPDPNGVTRVMPALIPSHNIEGGSQYVYYLAFSFIAPLGAHYDYILHNPKNDTEDRPNIRTGARHWQAPVPATPNFSSSQSAIDHTRDVLLGRGTDYSLGLGPALEQNQRGDAFDAVLLGGLAAVIHIQLNDLGLPIVFLGHRLDGWGQHAAGLAPLRPEVHQDRFIRFQNILLETLIGNFAYELAHRILRTKESN
jgi:hypothetical protein